MQKISIKSFVEGRERNFFALAVNELTSFTNGGSRDTVFPCIKNSQYYGNVPIFKNKMNFYR